MAQQQAIKEVLIKNKIPFREFKINQFNDDCTEKLENTIDLYASIINIKFHLFSL